MHPTNLVLQGSLTNVNELIDDDVHDARLSPHRLVDIHHTLRNSHCLDLNTLNALQRANQKKNWEGNKSNK